jgi:ADP-ribose pyrophosphatase
MKPDRSETVFDGKQFDVVLEEWEGRDREIVRHPGSVAVVAVDGEGRVTLVRQLREPARTELLELPAGTLEEGEEPLATAQRELAEECGLGGGEWRELGTFWTSPGFLDERMTLFSAEGVEPLGEQKLDEDERVELVRLEVAGLEDRLGDLEDLKTIAGLLLYLRGR